MRMAFYFDQSRCMACNACTVACKDYYNTNPGQVRWRRQATHEQDGSAGVFYSLVMACNHCENPACQTACAAGAISKRADGIVYVDRTKCRSYKACITACPFAEPQIADDKQEPDFSDKWAVRHPMQKCGLCMELLDKGENPVCMRACPAHAIQVGDYDELLRDNPGAKQVNPTDFPYAYENNTNDTGPSLIIKPRKPLTITGNYK